MSENEIKQAFIGKKLTESPGPDEQSNDLSKTSFLFKADDAVSMEFHTSSGTRSMPGKWWTKKPNFLCFEFNRKKVPCERILKRGAAYYSVSERREVRKRMTVSVIKKPCPEGEVWNDCFGTYKSDDGTKYVGEWKDDKSHGEGTETYANGDKYTGEWKDGKRNGQGRFIYDDGKVKQGIWENGNFLKARDVTGGEGRFVMEERMNQIIGKAHKMIVASLEKQLPKRADPITTMQSIKSSGSRLFYNYVIDVRQKEFDSSTFIPMMKSKVKNLMCNKSRKLYELIRIGAKYIYSYIGSDGNALAEFTIDIEECEG